MFFSCNFKTQEKTKRLSKTVFDLLKNFSWNESKLEGMVASVGSIIMKIIELFPINFFGKYLYQIFLD